MRIVPTLLLLLSFHVSAEMYKWVDDNGVSHYSNKPHDGAEQLMLLTKEMIGLPVTAPTLKLSQDKPTPSVTKKPKKKIDVALSKNRNDETKKKAK